MLFHDAVRPGITEELLTAVLHHCTKTEKGTALSLSISDSIFPNTNKPVLLQTPQAFVFNRIYEAYKKYPTEGSPILSYYKLYSTDIDLLPGSPENFKITFPEDITLFKYMYNGKNRITI